MYLQAWALFIEWMMFTSVPKKPSVRTRDDTAERHIYPIVDSTLLPKCIFDSSS